MIIYVLASIQLNDKLLSRGTEIYDVFSDWMLSTKMYMMKLMGAEVGP